MLVQIGISNYKSIDERIVLSLLATKEERHPSIVRSVGDLSLLPVALIVGPNGAGKSNLFHALQHMQDIILNTVSLPYYPHHLNPNEETAIDLQLMLQGRRYAYGIAYNGESILEEYFAVIENEEPMAIFEREGDTVTLSHQSVKLPTHESAVHFLSEGASDDIRLFYQFVKNHLIVALVNEEIEQEEVSQLLKESQLLKQVRTLLKRLDIGLEDLVLKGDTVYVKYHAFQLPLENESTGTRRLIYLLTVICDALRAGKVILIDELERNIHTNLTTTIIRLFNSDITNPQNAQLICSSHNTHLLDLQLLRQDQIWFMEKDFEHLRTDLYSLYNIEGVMDDENIEYGYVKGKYGATFKINFTEVMKDD